MQNRFLSLAADVVIGMADSCLPSLPALPSVQFHRAIVVPIQPPFPPSESLFPAIS